MFPKLVEIQKIPSSEMDFLVIKAGGKRKQRKMKMEMEVYTPIANVVGSTILDKDLISTMEAAATGTRNETFGLIGNTNNQFQNFFDLIFENDIPLQILCKKNVPLEDISQYEVPGCIMENAVDKMSMALIDFDPAFYAKEILETSRIVPGPRLKPFHATVKGMGGGKTRGLEEIRRELLLEEGVLSIAITFNSHWEVCDQFDNWRDIVGNDDVASYALSMVSRMASMFYDIKLSAIVRRIIRSLTAEDIDAQSVIHGFIQHMVHKISTYRHVHTCILMMDEIVRMDKYFKTRISSSIWRETLGTVININGSILNVGLVVSSLDIAPLGITTSTRTIHFITLSNNLNVTRIVDDMWNFKNITSDERFTLCLLAATVNSVPRLVEYAKVAIQDVLTIRKSESATLTKDDIRVVVESIIKRVKVGYRIRQPSDKLLKKIIFGEVVSLKNKGVRSGITHSIITNSVEPVDLDDHVIESVESSFMMLMSISYKSHLKELNNGFLAMMNAITEFRVNEVGFILEVISFEWMKCRIVVCNASKKDLSLASLLGLSKERLDVVISPKYKKIMSTKILTGNLQIKELSALATKDALDAVEFKVDSQLILIKPFQGERWDICLKTYLTNQSTPFYTFVELKSIDESEANFKKISKIVEGEITLETFPKNGTQYNATNIMMQNASNFMYIYINTYNSDSFSMGKVSCLNREDTFRFLGPIVPFYLVARGVNPGPLQPL
eukprot:gene4014-7994_t